MRIGGLLVRYAADGKTLKGARRADGGRVHLLGLISMELYWAAYVTKGGSNTKISTCLERVNH
ncbi:hypothetical protein [Nonomuraea sediminis]|uniref:hypothetical protein n=1 Tax=Nonomuraea sediminis TaxID=2835864 RepID=UPI001BDDA657|nr:hypothetical protein [Nonomuraea sediminis]